MSGSGVDEALYTEFCEINGYDDHNWFDEGMSDPQGDLRYVQYKDYRQSLATAPGFNSETHIIRDGGTPYVPALNGHLRTAYWQATIHGCNASTMWVWEREETDKMDPSVVKGSILHRPDCVDTLGQTALDINRLIPKITAFQNAPFEVRLLFSKPSLIYTPEYLDTVNEVYEILTLNGVKTGFARNEQIGSEMLSETEIIIVPNATHVDPAMLENLAEFASEQPVLLLGEDSLRFDPRDREISDPAQRRVTEAATTLSASLSRTDLRTKFSSVLESTGVKQNNVTLTDGSPTPTVEWQTAEYEGTQLLNIVNYGENTETVRITGPLAEGSAYDILNDEPINQSEIVLSANTPRLIEIRP
jgi:hypothetical protein